MMNDGQIPDSDASSSRSDLVVRAIAGDREALSELLDDHYEYLHRLLRGRIPRAHQAVISEDDVIQQTFIDAFLYITEFRPRSERSFEAWLATIVRRNLIDLKRVLGAKKRMGATIQRGAASVSSFNLLVEDLAGSSSSPSGKVSRAELENSVREAIEVLPTRYRMVIQLYDLQGQSANDCARRLSCTAGAVHMRRVRAIRIMGEFLAAQMGTGSSGFI